MYKMKLYPVCVCDRCGRVIRTDDHYEYQERISIDFMAGYGSVFGDGDRVRGDFCQHCVKAVLGRWLKVCTPDGSPEKTYRALQGYQRVPPER